MTMAVLANPIVSSDVETRCPTFVDIAPDERSGA